MPCTSPLHDCCNTHRCVGWSCADWVTAYFKIVWELKNSSSVAEISAREFVKNMRVDLPRYLQTTLLHSVELCIKTVLSTNCGRHSQTELWQPGHTARSLNTNVTLHTETHRLCGYSCVCLSYTCDGENTCLACSTGYHRYDVMWQQHRRCRQ